MRSDPEVVGKRFEIEANKIVTVDDVRHEIDVYVKTALGSPYEATWIFECKNWKEPAGKNEVALLAHKVQALGAARGYLVAGQLGKYGRAELKRTDRVDFIPCTDQVLSPFNNLQLIDTVHAMSLAQVSIKQRGVPPKVPPEKLNYKNVRCRCEGKPQTLTTFLEPHIRESLAEDARRNADKYRQPGKYRGEAAFELVGEPGELVINDLDVERMVVGLEFEVHTRRRKVQSKFEFEGRGRVFSLEPLDDFIPGKRLEVRVVQMTRDSETVAAVKSSQAG